MKKFGLMLLMLLLLLSGCTGGQHRSVAVAKALTDYLAARDANVRLRNRDFPKTI